MLEDAFHGEVNRLQTYDSTLDADDIALLHDPEFPQPMLLEVTSSIETDAYT